MYFQTLQIYPKIVPHYLKQVAFSIIYGSISSYTAAETREEFNILVSWITYRLHDDILTILYEEDFRDMVCIQSIQEKDIDRLQERKDPDKRIPMAHWIMLRRFVQSLNCRHHKPCFKEEEEVMDSSNDVHHLTTGGTSSSGNRHDGKPLN